LVKLLVAQPISNFLVELVEVAVFREGARADNTTAVVARLGDAEQEHGAETPVCIILDERQASA
jgi:hypothetical protein